MVDIEKYIIMLVNECREDTTPVYKVWCVVLVVRSDIHSLLFPPFTMNVDIECLQHMYIVDKLMCSVIHGRNANTAFRLVSHVYVYQEV